MILSDIEQGKICCGLSRRSQRGNPLRSHEVFMIDVNRWIRVQWWCWHGVVRWCREWFRCEIHDWLFWVSAFVVALYFRVVMILWTERGFGYVVMWDRLMEGTSKGFIDFGYESEVKNLLRWPFVILISLWWDFMTFPSLWRAVSGEVNSSMLSKQKQHVGAISLSMLWRWYIRLLWPVTALMYRPSWSLFYWMVVLAVAFLII